MKDAKQVYGKLLSPLCRYYFIQNQITELHAKVCNRFLARNTLHSKPTQ